MNKDPVWKEQNFIVKKGPVNLHKEKGEMLLPEKFSCSESA